MENIDILRSAVGDLEDTIHQKNDELSTKRAASKRCDQAIVTAEAGMSFRERYLPNWLGGNKDKVKEHANLITESQKLSYSISMLENSIARLRKQLGDTYTDYLTRHDATYQELLKPYDAALRFKDIVDNFLAKVDEAISEVEEAEDMETFDFVSDNKGISLASAFQNSDASDAIESVSDALPAFQKAVNEYNQFLKDWKIPALSARIDDSIDLAFDLVFDGFDFMSIATLSALEDAETELAEFREKIESVHKIVSSHMEKAGSSVTAYEKQFIGSLLAI
jgi:hypothetical protein